MKKFAKEFVLSSAFIWVFYILVLCGGVLHIRETVKEILFLSSFFLPIFVFVVVIIPAIYVSLIFRKDEKRFQKTFVHSCLSWISLGLIVSATTPIAMWTQNQVYFGGQSKELKQVLVVKAEKSLEKKLDKKFELVKLEYRNQGRFGDLAFNLDFKEEGNKKDYPITTVYLSHKEKGWRMKIINGDIWYMEK